MHQFTVAFASQIAKQSSQRCCKPLLLTWSQKR